MGRLRVWAAGALLCALIGCTPEESSDAPSCERDEECAAGQQCSAGACVVSTDGETLGDPCANAGAECPDPLGPDGADAVGICAGEGVLRCEDDVLICRPVSAPEAADLCGDGLDNDCDGSVDEADPQVRVPDQPELELGDSCQVGADGCASEGVVICDGGQRLRCDAPPVADRPELCDGLDNDCDGVADEGFDLGAACQVGVGTCVSEGFFVCDETGGARCDAQPQPALAELCNGVDDDCDGAVDEDFPRLGQRCSDGVGACQSAGVFQCSEDGAGALCVLAPSDGPSEEICGDGQDNDCDGVADEGFDLGAACTVGLGACQARGTVICDPATPTAARCSAAPGEARPDTDCDGVDDDCDGAADEGYVGVAVDCGVGACAAEGRTLCEGGALTDSCRIGEPLEDDFTCDNVDDDCDGRLDEDFEAEAIRCGVGICAADGLILCRNGQRVETCTPGPAQASDRDCDGRDDDCDGNVDEDYAVPATVCGAGACQAQGEMICVDGARVNTCQPGAGGADDDCDGVDDDCDGLTDEGYIPRQETCGVGACLNEGATRCREGEEISSCAPGEPAADVTCDGADNDCDGATDEGYEAQAITCGVGACQAQGAVVCEGGALSRACTPGAPAGADDDCDGVDDDCDGRTDEGYDAEIVDCGDGACAAIGRLICVEGALQNTCRAAEPSADDASCDGVDDDCDGAVDEDYVGASVSCGVGACAAEGQRICVGGRVQSTCQPGAPAPADQICDGVDDDCDGRTDEDYTVEIVRCGVGACEGVGRLTCVRGEVSNSCQPSAPAADDATCDGVDDDCDGQLDEDYEGRGTSCGVGACRSLGQVICVNGGLQNSCEPGVGSADDDCDGVDDDCDGRVDEAYVTTITRCGVGECQSAGRLVCRGGELTDTCQPGEPGVGDRGCDGLDFDCDGVIDEDYPGRPVTCGDGACQAEGEEICLNGEVTDTCRAGSPAPNDATCNGVDDDCDGAVDEDYRGQPTRCGVGVCAAEGRTLCRGGQIYDTCQPGNPASRGDFLCDGRDEDCDGRVDENANAQIEPAIELPGTRINAQQPRLAYADGFYGLAYSTMVRNVPLEMYFQPLTTDGSPLNDPVSLGEQKEAPSLIWGGDRFGLAYTSSNVYFAEMDRDGQILGREIVLNNGSEPDIGWHGEMGLIWSAQDRDRVVRLYTASSAGPGELETTSVLTEGSQPRQAQIAFNGEWYGAAWQDNRGGSEDVYFNFYAPEGEVLGRDVRVSQTESPSHVVDLLWVEDGYALVWLDEQEEAYTLYLSRLSGRGEPLGAPVAVTVIPRAWGLRQAAAAWAPELGGVILAWAQDAGGGRYVPTVRLYDLEGRPQSDPVAVGAAAGNIRHLTLGWADDRFTLVWTSNPPQEGGLMSVSGTLGCF